MPVDKFNVKRKTLSIRKTISFVLFIIFTFLKYYNNISIFNSLIQSSIYLLF